MSYLSTINTQTDWLTACKTINENYSKISVDIEKLKSATTKNKGYFKTLEDLKAAYTSTNSTVGMIAYVGTTSPYKIYEYKTSDWADTGETHSPSVNLGDYYNKEYIDITVNDIVTQLNETENATEKNRNTLFGTEEGSNVSITFENGTLDASTGQVSDNTNTRLRTVSFIETKGKNTVINTSEGNLLITTNYYNEIGSNYALQVPFTSENIIVNKEYKYFKLIVKRADNGTISTTEGKKIYISASGGGLVEDVNALKKSNEEYNSVLFGTKKSNKPITFENGTLDGSTGQVSDNTSKRLRTSEFLSTAGNERLINSSEGNLLIVINYYKEIGGNYVLQEPYTPDDIELKKAYPYFKLVVKKSDEGTITVDEGKQIELLGFTGGLIESVSEPQKNMDKSILLDFELPIIPAQNGTDESAIFNLNTVDVATFYSELDKVISNSKKYITKEVCGKDASETYEIWKLTLRNGDNPAPRKVLINANVHGPDGDPIDAAFTVFWLCKFLSEEYKTSRVARYIRTNYDFVLIPLANPWGLDNKSYGNANKVNCNRNYDYKFVPNKDFDYGTNSGPEAWSEPETRYIRDMVLANTDAYMWFDLHSYGLNKTKAFYEISGDTHTYNLPRAKRVFEHTKLMYENMTVKYYEEFDSEGWGPGWGAKVVGIYSPNLECGNMMPDGVKFSSEALTTDFYNLIGFLMFGS